MPKIRFFFVTSTMMNRKNRILESFFHFVLQRIFYLKASCLFLSRSSSISDSRYRPFYVPLYYTNPSPMFYGDYSTVGRILPNLYGVGSQSTLPGLGRINRISFMYGWSSGYFDVQTGVSATKYSLPYSVGQSFGAFGTLLYHPGERFYIKLFGSYSPDSRYGFNRTFYEATIRYDVTDRFGVEVGVQRYYEPQRGWQTAPIAIPYYRFNKLKFGIDMGGLLYEGIRNAVDK